MGTDPHPSADSLCAQILADARAESTEWVRRAQEQAETLHANATAEAERIKHGLLQAARAEADRRRNLILATIPVEAARLRARRVEALLESVQDDIRRQLLAREGFDYAEALVQLTADGISQMPGDTFLVSLTPADRAAFGDQLAPAVRRSLGNPALALQVAEDPALAGGGAVVKHPDGRLLCDNRLPARLARLWPDLRPLLAAQLGLIPESENTITNP